MINFWRFGGGWQLNYRCLQINFSGGMGYNQWHKWNRQSKDIPVYLDAWWRNEHLFSLDLPTRYY